MASPSQLFSCVDAGVILRSPINNSTAKSHWSFAKGQRFPSPKIECDALYSIPDYKVQRKASFGSGKKTDLEYGKNRHNVTPSPDTYNMASFVQTNESKKKGFFPGYGRQETAPRSYIDLDPKQVPGPGRYNHNLPRKSPYWSMRQRTVSELFPNTTQKIVPGPGQYNSSSNIHPMGKYYSSKHRSSKSKAFNPKHSKRFGRSVSDVPGTGTYHPHNQFSGEGIYVLSKNISAGKRVFAIGDRGSFVEEPAKRTHTPGPGSYRAPSDFGHYDDLAIDMKPLGESNTNRSRPMTSRRR